MMSKPEGCIMIKFNVSNGNPVPPPPPHSNAQTRLPHCPSPLLPPSSPSTFSTVSLRSPAKSASPPTASQSSGAKQTDSSRAGAAACGSKISQRFVSPPPSILKCECNLSACCARCLPCNPSMQLQAWFGRRLPHLCLHLAPGQQNVQKSASPLPNQSRKCEDRHGRCSNRAQSRDGSSRAGVCSATWH
jgi:hypothetical protein